MSGPLADDQQSSGLEDMATTATPYDGDGDSLVRRKESKTSGGSVIELTGSQLIWPIVSPAAVGLNRVRSGYYRDLRELSQPPPDRDGGAPSTAFSVDAMLRAMHDAMDEIDRALPSPGAGCGRPRGGGARARLPIRGRLRKRADDVGCERSAGGGYSDDDDDSYGEDSFADDSSRRVRPSSRLVTTPSTD